MQREAIGLGHPLRLAAGCFAASQPYTSGRCQEFLLDTTLTGSDFLALGEAAGVDGLTLRLDVRITADDGFAFYNYVESQDGGQLNLANTFSNTGLCSDGSCLNASSERLRIEVPVPLPSTLLLMFCGAALALWRRRLAPPRPFAEARGALGIVP